MESFVGFRLVVALIIVTGIAVVVGGGNRASAVSGHSTCRVHILPRTEEDRLLGHPSKVTSVRCGSSSDIAAQPMSGWVILELYENANFGGSSIQWISDTGCSGDYGSDDFNPLGWNDRASSAKPFCGRTINLWEHTYQQGASLQFSSDRSTLGVLDNQSSSWDTAW